MKLIKVALLLNVLLTIAFGLLFFAQTLRSQLDARIRYTALDRAEVINHEALRTFDPVLAQGDRNRVPDWICEVAQKCGRQNAVLGLAATLMNAIVMGFLGAILRRQERQKTAQG